MEGDVSGSLPHRASTRNYLPKSSILSLKPDLSLTDPEAGPHIPRPNDGDSSSQVQWPSEADQSPGLRELRCPRFLPFLAPRLKAPPPWAMILLPHSGATTHLSSLQFPLVPSSLYPCHLRLFLSHSQTPGAATLSGCCPGVLEREADEPMT